MFTAIMLALASLGADDKPGGWPDLFPELGNFSRKVYTPTLTKDANPPKDDKPKLYSQEARYEWLGGRFEVLTVKIWRDSSHKETYAADAVKKLKPAAMELTINKKRAYLWNLMQADKLDKVNAWLVVVLDDDKVLVIQQYGAGLELAEVAKKLDFDKIIQALENPPPKP